MHKRFLIALLCCMLFPALAFAQTGKVAGKVLDRETGEPLIGANVVVEGVDRGSATNINGEFVILNVPIGKVTLVASYIGYQQITIRDVLVRSDETTGIDFELPSEAFKVGEVEIMAEKPLVDKNVTNSKATITQDEIQNLPVRGVEGMVALAAGAVSQEGNIYVRGSRPDATGYVVDGVWANDPVNGGRSLTVIDNAIQEVNFQAGGYSAEYGGANGGLIQTTTRSGGRKLQLSLEAYSDAWGDVGEENFLGSYNYGYSRYILTAGGPIAGPVKFFVAGQNTFSRTPARYRQPYDLADKYDALLRATPAHSLLSQEEQAKFGIFDPRLGSSAKKIDYTMPGGLIHNNATEALAFNGNVTFDLNPVNIRVGGTYGYTYGRDGDWSSLARDGFRALDRSDGGIISGYQTGTLRYNQDGSIAGYDRGTGIANTHRALQIENEDYSANLKLTHLLTSNTFYEVFVNYFSNFNLAMDHEFQHDLFSYGDSIEASKYGYTYGGDGVQPERTQLFGDLYDVFGTPHTGYAYQKDRYSSISTKLNFVHQIGRTHEIKVGGDAALYTIRRFAIVPWSLKTFVRQNPDADLLSASGAARTNYFGYDYLGRQSDDERFGPKKPVFASAYVMDKIELEDLVINLGLRYDYIDTDTKEFIDPSNVQFDENGLIDQGPENMKDTEATNELSPRIGFSFPVTDQTVFYAQYGKFVQQSRLRDIYLGNALTADNIKGGYAIEFPVGFGLKPELTTQYDFGFRQQVGDFLAFDIGAFYKDIKDQIQQAQITGAPGAAHSAYFAWINGDYATSYGVQFKLDLRRVERVQMSLDYAYTDARGTGSAPSSSFRSLWQSPTEDAYLPKFTTPLDFDQTHRGSLNLDYRFAPGDGGPILERLGLNMLFTFNSGRPYTLLDGNSYANRRAPVEVVNSSTTPWNFQLDARLDKTVSIGSLDFNFYIWVINLLDTRNVTDVFYQSGNADSDNYLSTDVGKQLLQTYASYGPVFEQLYTEYYHQTKEMNVLNANNNSYFGPPRQVRLGVRMEF